MTSKTTMRRTINASGGFYDRDRRLWVFPMVRSNLTCLATGGESFGALEDAYDYALDYAAVSDLVRRYDAAEASHLRNPF